MHYCAAKTFAAVSWDRNDFAVEGVVYFAVVVFAAQKDYFAEVFVGVAFVVFELFHAQVVFDH